MDWSAGVMATRRVRHALNDLKRGREKKADQYSALLGIVSSGNQVVEVPSRPGYVWIRLRNSFAEVAQAWNDSVAPVYNLPVLVERDPAKPTRYRVVGRDVARFSNWGTNSPYLGTHGFTHAFGYGGGDVVWVDTQQITKFMVQPSGSVGGLNLTVNSGVYYHNSTFRFAGGTGTPSLAAYVPTDGTAKIVIVYLDKDTGNFALQPGTSTFSNSITGTAQIVQYFPPITGSNHVPLAGVRLVSGTSSLVWANLVDVRPWMGIGF